MARRSVLGNDPFERGAAVRPELQPSAAQAAPPPAATERTSEVVGERVKPAAKAKNGRREGRSTRTRTSTPTPTPPQTPTASPTPTLDQHATAAPAPSSRQPESPPGAPPHFQTAGERLRQLFGQALPGLVDRLGRLASEGLGFVTPPTAVPEIDDFGMSEAFFRRWQPSVAFVLRRYFRLVADGLEHVPVRGPAILVCNHSGVLPYDEVLVEAAVAELHPAHRVVRPLTEDFAIHLPFAGSWLNRFGCVRACPENAERLLAAGHVIAVFPEGSRGIGKLYRDRYRLQRFGRGGFVKIALRAQVPIVPMALLGAEEANPVIARLDLPRSVGVPYLPVTPTFPWLGPLGLWPLPTRLFLRVGAPIELDRKPHDAEDRPLVARLAEDVRARVQEILDGMRAERRSVFW
ncbi:MAG TPA: lysophospholipid acyltransferase family protein [Myxococcales bacterium]|nr:lysophospholipid acyltransferase family protein [Myxococcales bacterium]